MRYLAVVIFLAFFWFFASNFIIQTKNQSVFYFRQALLWPKWLVAGIFKPALNYQDRNQLELENKALKAELEILRQSAKRETGNSVLAQIYSNYPFNNKSLLSINVGLNDGVKVGMTATVKGGIFLGVVDKVFNNYSIVKTIFNPGWQLPIRVGQEKIEALLTGGPNLLVSMIAENKNLKSGDQIIIASKDFPFGLLVGEISEIKQGGTADVFKEASVNLPYNINDLVDLWLIK